MMFSRSSSASRQWITKGFFRDTASCSCLSNTWEKAKGHVLEPLRQPVTPQNTQATGTRTASISADYVMYCNNGPHLRVLTTGSAQSALGVLLTRSSQAPQGRLLLLACHAVQKRRLQGRSSPLQLASGGTTVPT